MCSTLLHDGNERAGSLTCACSTAFTANLHVPENQQRSAYTERRSAHSLFFDLQRGAGGRSLSPRRGVSDSVRRAHLDEILRVVRVELGRHFCCVCGVVVAGTRKSKRGVQAVVVSWQAKCKEKRTVCECVRAGLCSPAGARVKGT